MATTPLLAFAQTSNGQQFYFHATLGATLPTAWSVTSGGILVPFAAAAAVTNAPAGLASITVTAYGPVGTVKPIATQAAISVAGFAAVPSVKPIATQGAITVTAYGPVGTVAVVGGLAAVGVTANQPAASIKPVATQAAVSVAGFNATAVVGANAPATLASITVTAFGPVATIKPVATQAAIAVTAFGPVGVIAAVAGQAAVSVTGFNATAVTGANALATQAAVAVTAYGPVATASPVAGQAAVSVAGFNARATVSSTASAADVGVEGFNATGPGVGAVPLHPWFSWAQVDGIQFAWDVIVAKLLVGYESPDAFGVIVGLGAGAGDAASATAADVSVTGYDAKAKIEPRATQAAITVTGFDAIAQPAVASPRSARKAIIIRVPLDRGPSGIAVVGGGHGVSFGGNAYADVAVVSVTGFTAKTTVVTGPATQGAVSVAGFAGKAAVRANVTTAPVSVQGFNATTFGSGNAPATTAAVSVQGFDATTQVSGVPDRVRSRRTVLRQPTPRPLTVVTQWLGGYGDMPDRIISRRTIVQAFYSPRTPAIYVSGGGFAEPFAQGISFAGTIAVAVAGFAAVGKVAPIASLATVSVVGFDATATQGSSSTGATTAAVGVQGFNATCKVSPRAGLASVAVTASDADTPAQLASATTAAISVQGFNATTTSILAAQSAMATLAPISVKGFNATTRVLRGDDKVWPVTWWTPRTWVSDIGVRDLNRYVRDNIKSMRQKQVMDVAAVFAAATTQYTNAAPFNNVLMSNVIGAARADILDTFLWGVPHESMVMHLIGTLEVKADGTSGIPSSFMINFVDNAGQDFTAGSYEGINFYYAAPTNVAMSIPFIATLDGPVTYGYQLQMSVASGGLFNIVVNASVIFAPKSFAAVVDLPNLILDDPVFGRLDFDDLP